MYALFKKYTPRGWDAQKTLERIPSNYCLIMRQRHCCTDCTTCHQHIRTAIIKEGRYWSEERIKGNPKATNWNSYWSVTLRTLARVVSERMITDADGKRDELVISGPSRTMGEIISEFTGDTT